MTHFEFWKTHAADMPAYQNGQWVDLETGLAYNPNTDYGQPSKSTVRYNPSQTTKEYRALAKMYGGAALTGTAKQKEWGEKIRAQILASNDLELEDKQELASAKLFKSAKFWIENRTKKAAEFKIEGIIELIRETRRIKEDLYNAHSSHDVNELNKQLKAVQNKMWLNL